MLYVRRTLCNAHSLQERLFPPFLRKILVLGGDGFLFRRHRSICQNAVCQMTNTKLIIAKDDRRELKKLLQMQLQLAKQGRNLRLKVAGSGVSNVLGVIIQLQIQLRSTLILNTA